LDIRKDGPVTEVNSLLPRSAATDIVLGQYSVVSTEIVRDKLARGIVPLYTKLVSSCKRSREASTPRVDRVTALEHNQKMAMPQVGVLSEEVRDI
jgi:hypothetical protein